MVNAKDIVKNIVGERKQFRHKKCLREHEDDDDEMNISKLMEKEK